MSVTLTRLRDCLDLDLLAPFEGTRLVVAVSGGSDSMGLVHAILDIGTFDVYPVTFDHQLRASSTKEAEAVGDILRERGARHDILTWKHPTTLGLQEAARRARYEALTRYAKDIGALGICLGHTQDDQAETVLMNLLRGSGVDGLSGMKARRSQNGVEILRPLLHTSRQTIRAALVARNLKWFDDPSNENDQFLRVKTREFIKSFDLPIARIERTAAHMARAKDALERAALEFEAEHAVDICDVQGEWSRDAFLALADDTQFRVLTRALWRYAGQDYRPRFDALDALCSAIRSTLRGRQTLHHCEIWWSAKTVKICQEPRHLPPSVTGDELWNGRWVLDASYRSGYSLGALGANVSLFRKSWRAQGLSEKAARALPTLFASEGVFYVHRLSEGEKNWKSLPIVKKDLGIER